MSNYEIFQCNKILYLLYLTHLKAVTGNDGLRLIQFSKLNCALLLLETFN